MPDRIERTTTLHAPIERVWQAISEPAAVSAWFGANFEAPFVPGQPNQGTVTYPGYEGLTFELQVLEKKRCELFAFSWHPNTIDLERDYSKEAPTIVQFHLAPHSDGARLTVIEEGFDALPSDRAAEAFAANSEGWDMILEKIVKYVVDSEPRRCGPAGANTGEL